MSEALLSGLAPADSDTGPEVTPLGEGRMVREDGWREVHRLFHVERQSKSEIARQVARGSCTRGNRPHFGADQPRRSAPAPRR